MAFEKGHEKLGCRKPNTPNKTHPEHPRNAQRGAGRSTAELWHKYFYNKDPAIAFEAFKLANQYMFGKPAQSPIASEDQPVGGQQFPV